MKDVTTRRVIWKASQAVLAAFALANQHARAVDVLGRIDLKHSHRDAQIRSGAYDLRASVPTPSSPTPHSVFENIAVWLEPTQAEPLEARRAEMRQISRRLEPRLLIVPVGSTVSFPNMDPIFHNVFSLSHSSSFDLGYYPKGASRNVTFSSPGVVQIYCHIHSDMYGAIVVTPSRWYGKPSADGTFVFHDVGPGKYQLMVWMRSAGLKHKSISVPPTGNMKVNLSLPDPDED